jgi:transposase
MTAKKFELGRELTPRRLADLLDEQDILNSELATMAGVSTRTVYRWLAGTTPIPRSVVAMLELLPR